MLTKDVVAAEEFDQAITFIKKNGSSDRIEGNPIKLIHLGNYEYGISEAPGNTSMINRIKIKMT